VLLDQEEQALFGLEVMIETSQRHACGAGKIAHGCPFVALEAKDLGGMIENVSEAAVEAGDSSLAR
jgi:hypothetical protein